MKPESSHSVELEEFVHADEIDPMQLERSYWLGPDRESAARPFALFQKALADEKLVGIGRIVLGTKEQLVCVRPVGDGLALTTLFYADEVTPEHEIERTEAEVGEKELKVARQLVSSLVTKWDPKEHRDTYRDQLLQMIEAKAAGETVEAPKPSAAKQETKPADLLAALEASLAAAKDRATGTSEGQGETTTSPRRSRVPAALPPRRPDPPARWLARRLIPGAPTRSRSRCRSRCSRAPRRRCPAGDDWVFEVKWDGIRIVARVAGGDARLWSRGGDDVTERHAEIATALAEAVGDREAVIDGELCALDD